MPLRALVPGPGVPEASWIQKLRIPFELVEGALKEVRSRTRKAPWMDPMDGGIGVTPVSGGWLWLGGWLGWLVGMVSCKNQGSSKQGPSLQLKMSGRR